MRIVFLTALLAALVLAQSPPDIEVLHVRGNVYMFASDGGNVTVQVGEHRDNDGVLMVDTGSAQMAGRIQAELKKLTTKPLRYVVNTSSDPDHAGGNATMGKPGVVRDTGGPQGAPGNIYPQDNLLTRLPAQGSNVSEDALPTPTSSHLKHLPLNGQT